MTLDDAGCYTDVMPSRFKGLDVIRNSGKKRGQDGKANNEVLKALVECGNLLSRGIITLRDAHSWRSKAPVIRRATPQWFISMSKKGLREKALEAIDKTKFWPERGRNRIASMVSDRPDWLISRQRSWGVPITLIIGPNGELHTDRADAESINNRILEAIRKYGVDGWFDTPLEEFIPKVNNGWHKVNDILDVWFDSGCTHAFCLKTRSDLPGRADLYLEGSDQHRGWFQSSLLESCAVYGEAPYDGVLTDGFVVDDKGLKMSKSLGNTMSPEDINKQYGAEILRLWVANSETTTDLKIGREIIQTNVDTYRKLRNTLRYMLGALDGYNLANTVKYSEMPGLEKWVLHRLSEITLEHERLVRDHDHKRIFTMLFNFCTLELSSFYFDIRKDALYCDPIMSLRRQACLTVMDIIFQRLATWLAPVMCFTMEEVWKTRFPNQETSVHLQLFKKAPKEWFNQDIARDIEIIRTFRGQVSEAIEPMRRDKQIKSSLEASVAGPKNSDLVKAASNLGISLKNSYSDPCNPSDTLADYLIVSICEFSDGNNKIDVTDLKETGFNKCERSWKYFEGDGEITDRDAAAVEFFENNIEID
jgi:isoleucyl-tRNA synthetase